jgi:uncharacterized membrane-anchored protein
MKNLADRTRQELLNQFRDVCLAQYETYITGNTNKYNKLFDNLVAITRELKRRGLEERRALLTLLTDKNPQVRVQAAKSVYSVAPREAKACLEVIAAAGLPDQSLSAGMTLSRLEEAPNCLDWI